MQKALEAACLLHVYTCWVYCSVSYCLQQDYRQTFVTLSGCTVRLLRTCPPKGRGSCRAAAQTAACGRSCGEPSWCYAVSGGDWTVASVLWHPRAQINKKHMNKWTKRQQMEEKLTKRPNRWSKRSKEEGYMKDLRCRVLCKCLEPKLICLYLKMGNRCTEILKTRANIHGNTKY